MEPSDTKGKPAISLRQRAFCWLREGTLATRILAVFKGRKNADFVNTLAVVAGDDTRHQHNGEKPNESAENLGNEFGYPENLEEFELSPESRAFWYGMYNPLKVQPRRRFIHVAWEIESGPPKP